MAEKGNYDTEVGGEIRDLIDVAVMHVVSAGKYWLSEPAGLKMSEQRECLQKLEETLTRLLSSSHEMLSIIPMNKLIAVKNAETGRWHRGELLSPPPTSISSRVRVFLIDHGAFLVNVKPNHLQVLPEEMHELPRQAFVTCLYGLIPLTVNVHLEDIRDKIHLEESPVWTPASETFVHEMLAISTSALLRGIVCKGHTVHGEIFLTIPGQGLVSLNKALYRNEYAIYSKEKYQKVIEREAILESKMAENRALITKADEGAENFTIQQCDISKIKHILMEDFMKEYASKKLERQENTARFLNAMRHASEMNGLKEDDSRRREDLIETILSSPIKAVGRGCNLKILKHNTASLPRGRGLALPVVEKQPTSSSVRNFHQYPSSSILRLLDLLSAKPDKKMDKARDSQSDNSVNNSVLNLGMIPAGYPIVLQERSSRHKKMKGILKSSSYRENSNYYAKFSGNPGVIGRGINVHQSKDKEVNRVVLEPDWGDTTNTYGFPTESLVNSGENTESEVEEVIPVGKSECNILKISSSNPRFLQEATNDKQINVGIESELEKICSHRKETSIPSEEGKTAVLTCQANDSVKVDSSFYRNKILKMMRNHSKNNPQSTKLVANNAEVADSEKSESSLKSVSNGNKPKTSCTPVEKIHHLMRLQSQHVAKEFTSSEEAVPFLNPSGDKKQSDEIAAKSKKGKTVNPLYSLLDFVKKKSKASNNNDAEKHSDCQEKLDLPNVSLKTNSMNSFDDRVEKTLLDCNSFEASNAMLCNDKNSMKCNASVSENFEHLEVKSSLPQVFFNGINAESIEKEKKLGDDHYSSNEGIEISSMPNFSSIEEINDGFVRSEETGAKVSVGDGCPNVASPPAKIRAAIDIFTEAMKDFEGSHNDSVKMDLTNLRKELKDIIEKVTEQSSYKASLMKAETPVASIYRNEQQNTSGSTVASKSSVKEFNRFSDKMDPSSSSEHDRLNQVMTTIVETDTASTYKEVDVVKNPLKKFSVIQSSVTEKYSSILHHDNSQVNISEISDCCVPGKQSPTKSLSSKIQSGMKTMAESNLEELQKSKNGNLKIPQEKLSSNGDLHGCSSKTKISVLKPVESYSFEQFVKNKHLKGVNKESDEDKNVEEIKEKSYVSDHIKNDKISTLLSDVSLQENLGNKIVQVNTTKALETCEFEKKIIPEIEHVEEIIKMCKKSAKEQHEVSNGTDELTKSNEISQSKLCGLNLEYGKGENKKSNQANILSNVDDQDDASKEMCSFAKFMLRKEAEENSKTYNAIKDEGISIANLSSRLPLCAAQDIIKSKGSSLSLNSNCSLSKSFNQSSTNMEIKAKELVKQKTLEPEVVSPSLITPEKLPSLLRTSWLSDPAIGDCLLTTHRLKMCRILVRGHFLAQPIQSIAQATFSKSLHMALSRMGYRDPMRIQSYAWPALMRGHNLVMVNPPHSGKTLGYLVPIISFMLSPDLYSEIPDGNGPLVLILCPSWSGVIQTYEFCQCLLSEMNSHIQVIPTYGGIETEQTIPLLIGCHILISTPRCYIRLLRNNRFTTNLDRLCHLVFDEADILMKLFLPEVKEVLRECRLLLQRRARLAAEVNPSGDAESYQMVKLIAAAKSWCPQMESFVTNIVEKPLLCIGSYLEAAVYARLKPTLHLVGFVISKEENKDKVVPALPENKIMEVDDIVLGILKKHLGLYKIVVVCESVVEVQRLTPKIRNLDANLLVVHENVHHVDIAEARHMWMCSQLSGALPVLLVSDEALPEVNIENAEHLVHVGVPSTSKTQFGLRFSTLMDNYRDIFDKDSAGVKNKRNCFVDIVVDITEPEVELTGLIEFLQRLGMSIPPELDAAASKTFLCKEMKRKRNVALCPNLKSFGECSAVCKFRHVVFPDADQPWEGVPTCGEVRVKILNVLDASHMSARLLEHTGLDGTKTIFPNDYYYIASGLARYYRSTKNRLLHGIPEVGDLCAIENELNLFHRARVEAIVDFNPDNMMPIAVSVNLIDEGIKRKAKIYQLLHLPDDLKKYTAQARELIVCRVIPRDLDSSWSKAACVKVADWLEEETKGEMEGKIIVGVVVIALGNTMWIDPLECREWLENQKTTVVHLSLRLDLLRAGLAIDNPSHVQQLRKLCEIAGVSLLSLPSKDTVTKEDTMESYGPENLENKLEFGKQGLLADWEILNSDKLVEVNVLDVENPYCFRVQKVTTSDKLKDLSREIQSWISDVWHDSLSKNADQFKEHCVGSLCLGFFKAENSWNRAKVVSVSLMKFSPSITTDSSSLESEKNSSMEEVVQYTLFFVDYGDKATVSSSEVAPIPNNFITQLPFQTIECSLMGVKPLKKESESSDSVDSNEKWNDEVSDAFYELCREGDGLDIYRPLLAKVFGTDGMGVYGGTKYLVILYDKGNDEGPIHIAELLVERGLAISCQVLTDGEADDEMDDECKDLESHWLDEGALIPFTPALTLSDGSQFSTTQSQLESLSITSSPETSSCAALVAVDGRSSSDQSENMIGQSSVDDDAESYEVVMSDDEVKLYEERIRNLLGIPSQAILGNEDGERLLNEDSRTIQTSSSFGRFTSDGEDMSSVTSYEDLAETLQQSCGRFEEISEENIADLSGPKVTISIRMKQQEKAESNIKETVVEKKEGIVDIEDSIKSQESSYANLEMGDWSHISGCVYEEDMKDTNHRCMTKGKERWEDNVVEDEGMDERKNSLKEQVITNAITSKEANVEHDVTCICNNNSSEIIHEENVSSENIPNCITPCNSGVTQERQMFKNSSKSCDDVSSVKMYVCEDEVVSVAKEIIEDFAISTQNEEEEKHQEVIKKMDDICDFDVMTNKSRVPTEIEKRCNESDSKLNLVEENDTGMNKKDPDGVMKKTVAEDRINSSSGTVKTTWKDVEGFEFCSIESHVNVCSDVKSEVYDSKGEQDELEVKERLNESSVEHTGAVSFGDKSNEIQNKSMETLVNDHSNSVDCINVQLSSELTAINFVDSEGNGMIAYTENVSEIVNDKIVKGTDGNNAGKHDVCNSKDEQMMLEYKEGHEQSSFEDSNLVDFDSGCNRIGEDFMSSIVNNLDPDECINSQLSSEMTAAKVVETNCAENSSEVVNEEIVIKGTDENNVGILWDNVDDYWDKSTDEESYELMPNLVPTRTPLAKWAQNKWEVIVKVELPNMKRYNIYWESNSKLNIFASGGNTNESCYRLELQLWASVNNEKSEHMPISDSAVKVIMPKAYVYMEWPRLLLATNRPAWLSVDFDLMEFNLEDPPVEVPTKLINYKESDDETNSEDEGPHHEVRFEEVNYDPYDPFA